MIERWKIIMIEAPNCCCTKHYLCWNIDSWWWLPANRVRINDLPHQKIWLKFPEMLKQMRKKSKIDHEIKAVNFSSSQTPLWCSTVNLRPLHSTAHWLLYRCCSANFSLILIQTCRIRFPLPSQVPNPGWGSSMLRNSSESQHFKKISPEQKYC